MAPINASGDEPPAEDETVTSMDESMDCPVQTPQGDADAPVRLTPGCTGADQDRAAGTASQWALISLSDARVVRDVDG